MVTQRARQGRALPDPVMALPRVLRPESPKADASLGCDYLPPDLSILTLNTDTEFKDILMKGIPTKTLKAEPCPCSSSTAWLISTEDCLKPGAPSPVST